MKNPDEQCGWMLEANNDGERHAEVKVCSIDEALTWAENCMRAGMTEIRVLQEDRALAEARQKKTGNDYGYVIIGEPGHRELIEKLRKQS